MTLQQLLDDNKITQAWLAKSLSISPPAINSIVKHGVWPKRDPEAVKQKLIETLNLLGIELTLINQALTAAVTPSSGVQTTKSTAASLEEEQLMLLRKQTLSQPAKRQFKLFKNIFAENIRSSAEMFRNGDIDYVRESMYQAAKGNSSFIAVVGQSGAGKTTLRRELNDRIERERIPTIVIEPYPQGMEDNDTKGKTLKALHIAEAILSALAPSASAKRSPEARFRQIHNLLKESSKAGHHHLLIIEEAHSLPIPTLKHLKRFIELENGFTPLLSIILIGQDELKNKLAENNPEVREVVQRCEIVTLEPFTQTTLVDYLQHKCKSADRELSEFIDESGINAICAKLTRNVGRNKQNESLLYPLAVGNLLTGALNVAAELGADVVDHNLVMEV
ncbi:ExeA family protein [Acinetobacter sp. WCHAc060025]|uniref:ExeA family protein n=1 Tax=Acinetobacter sp. WCHAc060025 TaxID=2518625 RepID=UPI0010233686|nr:AAA family ATPase [Acinetobacter sp. WCHAc060025]RZG77755.1 transposase [Acinetobacter sp. WCHAc060025]